MPTPRLTALLLACACAGPTAAPTPDHPLGVGVRVVELVDASRPTPENGDEPGHPGRALPTRVWYPSLADLAADEVVDAAPDPGPWPLVVFVHGSSATPGVYAWFGRALARAGYVVAAADMPLTSLWTPGGPSDWHVEDQPADVAFLADRAFAGDLLGAGVIDPTPGYAVAGHSTGGTVAQLSAWAPGADDRVAAILPLSGDACFFDEAFFQARAVPVLVISGTSDLYVPAPDHAERTWTFALPPKGLVVLTGGTHMGFTDLAIDDDPGVTPDQPGDPLPQTLAAFGDASACPPPSPRAVDPRMPLDVQHHKAAAWSAAFLDAHLRAAPAALDALRREEDSAEVR